MGKMMNLIQLLETLPTVSRLQEHDNLYRKNGINEKDSVNLLQETRLLIAKWLLENHNTIEYNYKNWLKNYIIFFISSCSNKIQKKDFFIEIENTINNIKKEDQKNNSKILSSIIATMIIKPSFSIKLIKFDDIPPWLMDDFINYISQVHTVITDQSSIHLIYRHFSDYIKQFINSFTKENNNHSPTNIAASFVQRPSLINFYAMEHHYRDIWYNRAWIIEEIIRTGIRSELHQSIALDTPPLRTKKYRIGLLANGFYLGAEGYFLLSHLHDLPRDRLHVTLISTTEDITHFESDCARLADDYINAPCANITPENIDAYVTKIRAANLDLILFANNTSIAMTIVTLLSAHRLARIQVMSSATPLTSGFAAMDAYLSAVYNERPDGQSDYTEELVLMPQSVNYYAYHFDQQPATQSFDRAKLGLPADKVIIFAGGNFFKLTPHVIGLWIKLLAMAPETHLVLMPFSPGWLCDDSFPIGPIHDMLNDLTNQLGVSIDRLTLIPPVPTRADRHAIMALCDLYLDSFPFAGACSMLDPFLADLPIVARSIGHFRGLLSTAMLKETGLADMATDSDEDYLARALKLVQDSNFRAQEAARVRAVRLAGLPFFDTVTYGQRVADAFLGLLDRRAQSDHMLLQQTPTFLLKGLTEITRKLADNRSPLFASLNDQKLIEIMIAGYFDGLPPQSRHLIDIGGCLGETAKPFLQRGWSVDLFEPDPSCHPLLATLEQEFRGKLSLYGAVISDRHGEMVSFCQSDVGLSGLGESPFSSIIATFQVPSVRLDSMIQEAGINRIDVLKIDAEGYDFIALDSIGWDNLSPIHWPSLIMLEFGSNFAPQPLNSITAKIAEMAARGYGALVFSYDDDGNFAHKIWQHRLIDLTFDAPICNKAGVASGNIIFYRADNTTFLAYVLRQFAGMLHACDRPEWA
jgi:FkbM family methyltransferase